MDETAGSPDLLGGAGRYDYGQRVLMLRALLAEAANLLVPLCKRVL